VASVVEDSDSPVSEFFIIDFESGVSRKLLAFFFEFVEHIAQALNRSPYQPAESQIELSVVDQT
jgi:hypothetical protein